ncbi:MAG: KpsF/GutQ family sugar-phosphate isomerase [Candidatus Brocadiae bacterium]|nr:KpsF/GutQ family sugar-phosphate isomerase [Candidatus Brocadiia bacterium]
MDLDFARQVLATEADAIRALIPRLDDAFADAVRLILACKGRVVVTGMGKAGLIGQKISATLASTGTPSHFLHPAEAIHGDLGRVKGEDVVLALSNSGETEELSRLLPILKEFGTKIVALTATRTSTLGRSADIVICLGRIEEACPIGLAPSASTTTLLALGDALALVIQKERGFTREQFAFYHPAGQIGRRLLKVAEVMRTGDRAPEIAAEKTVAEAIALITRARAGAISIVDAAGKLAGIFTDGDLRRRLAADPGVLRVAIGEVMTRSPKTIGPDRFATEALGAMREKKIDEIPVVGADGRPVGMVDVQDLLDMGLV